MQNYTEKLSYNPIKILFYKNLSKFFLFKYILAVVLLRETYRE